MTRPRICAALLLVLTAASLLLGGGMGCEPQLEGVDFRPANLPFIPGDKNSPLDWYMAFDGKKPPGNAWAALPYPVKAPFGIEARMGVFLDAALLASAGAEACIGFRRSDLGDDYRLCVAYQLAPVKTLVFSNLDSLTADCVGATKAELDLDDDGVNVTARYRCPGAGSFTTLTTSPSRWSADEKWNAFTGAYALGPGAQLGFDAFRVSSSGEFSNDPEAEPAFYAFESLRMGIEAFYEIEDQADLFDAIDELETARANLLFGRSKLDPDFAGFRAADKLFAKSDKTHAKLLGTLLSGGAEKFQKSFPKLADMNACALEALDPGI